MAETGFLYYPYTTIRSILANSDTFQTWTGAADASAALGFVFMYETRDGLFDIDKYAVIVPPRGKSPHELQRGSGQGGLGLASFDRDWCVRLGFLEELSSGFSEAATQTYLSTIGALLADILASADLGNIDGIRQVPDNEEPFRWQEGEHDGYQTYFDISAHV